MKLFKLGTIVTDTATKIEGMLLNSIIGMDEKVEYIFQPKMLNPEKGTPVDVIMISGKRVKDGVEEDVDVPVQMLGTQAEDLGTGFKGTIIHLVYHLNGCLHVSLKPEGILKNGETVDAKEFDIRRLKGEAIPTMTTEQKEVSQKRTPSPTGTNLSCTKY